MATTGEYLSSVFVRIGADTSGLQQGLTKASGLVKQFENVAKSATVGVLALGAGIATMAVGWYAFARSGVAVINTQLKLARQLDATVSGLRSVQFAATEAGASTEQINAAIAGLNTELVKAQSGSKSAAQALKVLGLEAKTLSGKDVDERLATIADRIKEMGLSGAQTTVLLKDLGITQSEIISLVQQGGEAIRDARKEITAYGLAIDDIDAATVEAAINTASNAFARLDLMAEGLRTTLAVKMAPTLLELGGRFSNIARVILDAALETDKMDGAGKKLGANTAIINFARGSALAMARLADSMVKAVNVVDVTIKGLDVVSWATTLEGARKRVEDGPGFLESMFGADRQEDINNYTLAMIRHQQAVDALAKSQADLAAGSGRFEKMVREGWDMKLPDVNLPPGPGGGADVDLGGGSGGRLGAAKSKETDAETERLQSRLETLQKYLMNETETELAAFYERQELLGEAREKQLISDEEFRALEQQLEADGQAKLSEIQKKESDKRVKDAQKERKDRVDALDQMFGNLVGLMNTGNRQMFEIGKVAAVAQATVKGYQAVVDAYEFGTRIGGPYLGAAMAATAGIATAAQIAQISSVQFGGGGGSPATGYSQPTDALPAGSGAAGGAEAAQERGAVTIQLQGTIFGQNEVRELINQINEAVGDGARIRVA